MKHSDISRMICGIRWHSWRVFPCWRNCPVETSCVTPWSGSRRRIPSAVPGFFHDFRIHLFSPSSWRLRLGICEFWASEDYFFHHSEQLQLVSTVCPNIRKMLFMFRWVASCWLIQETFTSFNSNTEAAFRDLLAFGCLQVSIETCLWARIKILILGEFSLTLAGARPVGWRLLCRRALPNLHPDGTPAHKAQFGKARIEYQFGWLHGTIPGPCRGAGQPSPHHFITKHSQSQVVNNENLQQIQLKENELLTNMHFHNQEPQLLQLWVCWARSRRRRRWRRWRRLPSCWPGGFKLKSVKNSDMVNTNN